jgi:rhodanese-related sulfurtransferase
MRLLLSRLTLNQKLAALAVVLGAIAVFARPTPGGTVSIDPAELAVIVQTEADHVVPPDLADWIVAGRADFRVVDIRDEKAFTEYHIPGAENVRLAQLPDAGFARNEKIVLYSDGGIHSAQAWFLLKAKGYKGVYMLRDGLDGWKDQVLFPVLTENPTPFQSRRDEQLKRIAAHFGGQARTSSGATAAEATKMVAMPNLRMPAAGAAPKRKKKEGC